MCRYEYRLIINLSVSRERRRFNITTQSRRAVWTNFASEDSMIKMIKTITVTRSRLTPRITYVTSEDRTLLS